MSWEAQAWVWAQTDLPSLTKLVALSFAGYADRDGKNIRPGLNRIQAETGVGERTVQRARDDILLRGKMRVTSAATGRGNVSTYEMPVDMEVVAAWYGPF